MTAPQYEQDVQAVFDHLMQGPFQGSAWDLAKAVGISYDRVNEVLWAVRKPEFVEEHHWTIPFVVRGADTNTWQIVDMDDKADNLVMRESQHRRTEEMRKTNQRNIAQAQLALGTEDGRTTLARRWRTVLRMLEATEEHLALILEDYGDNGTEDATT